MKHSKKEMIDLIGCQTNSEVLIEKHNEHNERVQTVKCFTFMSLCGQRLKW